MVMLDQSILEKLGDERVPLQSVFKRRLSFVLSSPPSNTEWQQRNVGLTHPAIARITPILGDSEV